MAKSMVVNIAGNPNTVPAPYARMLLSGESFIIGDTAANVTANLGGASALVGKLLIIDVPDGNAVSSLPAALVPFLFTVVAPAKSATSIVAATAANAANALVVAGNPDIPRNLRAVFAASYDGGDVTVVGTDQSGAAQTEVFTGTANTTQVGVKIFKTVTSATKATVGATANTVSVGTGDKLGIGVPNTTLRAPNGHCSVAGVPESATTDIVNAAFTPTTTPAGTTFKFVGYV